MQRKKVLKKPNFAEIAFGNDINAELTEPLTSDKKKKILQLEQVKKIILIFFS
jgi:hypothetical protein